VDLRAVAFLDCSGISVLLATENRAPRRAERTHLVAQDLSGFGHSQRSDPLLFPRAMGEFTIAAVDAFGLECSHVVALVPAPRPPGNRPPNEGCRAARCGAGCGR
jgi:hypothetical protein